MSDLKILVAETTPFSVINLDAYKNLCLSYNKKSKESDAEDLDSLKMSITTMLVGILKYYYEEYKINFKRSPKRDIKQIQIYLNELDDFRSLTNLVDTTLFDSVLMEVFKDD